MEFAISSTVLILLFGGLVDIARAVQFADVLHNAAREGARYGAAFSEGSNSNPHLNDSAIKGLVDEELRAGGLPASIQRGTTIAQAAPNSANCSLSAPDNSQFNPPYAAGSFPATANQPWLYICEDTRTIPNDLNVAVLMTYGPLTAFLPPGSIPGGFPVSANWHLNVQR